MRKHHLEFPQRPFAIVASNLPLPRTAHSERFPLDGTLLSEKRAGDAKIATILWYKTTIRIAAAQVQRLAAEFLLQMASRNEGANWQDPRKTWPSAMPAQPFHEN